MSKATVVFDPYAAADMHNFVQTIVDNHNVASTGHADWYPVAFFLKDENGEVLGGLLGDIWAAWLHVRTLAVAAPVRGHGFGRELMKRAETYAVERGCTDAFLDTFSFQARPFYAPSAPESKKAMRPQNFRHDQVSKLTLILHPIGAVRRTSLYNHGLVRVIRNRCRDRIRNFKNPTPHLVWKPYPF